MNPDQTQRAHTAATLRRWAAQCETSWDGWRLAAFAVDGADIDPAAAAWADAFCLSPEAFSGSTMHAAGDAALALCFAASACEAGDDPWERFQGCAAPVERAGHARRVPG